MGSSPTPGTKHTFVAATRLCTVARAAADVAKVVELSATGLSPYAIAKITGLPRETIRGWVVNGAEGVLAARMLVACDGQRCEVAAAAPHRSYAYLLGQYLGDGHIATHKRGVHRLVITCCDQYPGIVTECEAALRLALPRNGVDFRKRQGVVAVSSYSKHWPCFFPQHGLGRKHERPIALVDWQRAIVEENPWPFIRGLIHSDGCRVINRVHAHGRWYAYPRYFFSNESHDILELFADACDLVGVEWRYNRYNSISVARRASVALLDQFVGPKS